MAKRIIIPARLASTRLAGKALLDIAGKPMIQHVWEQAIQCEFDTVLIATDNQKILETAEQFGADVIMTSNQHQTGTDRLAEAAQLKDYDPSDLIVNVQGDEPLIPIDNIKQVANNLDNNTAASISTLCDPIDNPRDIFDAHAVKVVFDQNGFALYFSRAAIPWQAETAYRHIGLYAYRAEYLLAYNQLEPCYLEKIESLEQLRALYYGHKIHVDIAKTPSGTGVDTQEDLNKVRQILQKKS
jgi:3-deoxy-manno-octulosonate cytidylyltransferase (CMP-KDO synthetase)